MDAAITCGAQIIGVNAEDASRTDESFLIEFAKAVRIRELIESDIVILLDMMIRKLHIIKFTILHQNVGIPVELHFHNDLGMAVANSVMGAKAAVDAGVDAYINTAINGMGERAGNADLVSCLLSCFEIKRI